VKTFGCDPRDLEIWLSPAAGKTNYLLWKRQNMSLREANVQDFLRAGVSSRNIVGGEIDTTIDPNYWSNSRGDKTKRFAITAKIV
jgi:copper oxidase (laccase) domain-containing protein